MTRNIGIIGLGSIGFRHAKNLLDLGHQVIGYDPELFRRVELEKLGGHNARSEEDLLVHYDLDGIVIASPTPWHKPHIEAAFQVDCGCFVEKPIADTLDDKLGWVDMVGYNLRYHSSVIKAKEVLGEIGIPIWASFICSQKNERPGYLRDGVIFNWSHEIDLAIHLLGPATVVASATRLTKEGFDDLVDITLLHEGGCRSTVHLDYCGDPEIRKFTVMGTKGTLTANLCTPRFVVVHRAGQSIQPLEYGTDSFDQNYITEIKDFLAVLDGKESKGCTGPEALDVLDICQQVRKQAGLE